MHWHGIRLLNNNIMDGVPGVTECPISPGKNKTYSFLATQYGTSWYHSHISSQYGNGVTGSIVIYGPASQSYDIDLGVLPISDWYYKGADALYSRVNNPSNPFIPGQPGSPPTSDNIFINGTNINPTGKGGKYATITLTKGKQHRLRLINPSADNTFTVSIVGHDMTIIQTDFVPIKPYKTDSIYMGIGQRYDVIIEGSCKPGNYWLNVTLSKTGVCGTSNNPFPAAVVHYEGYLPADIVLPTDHGKPPPDSLCSDRTDFTPIVTTQPPATSFSLTPSNNLSVALSVDNTANHVFWTVNSSAIDLSWEYPTLSNVRTGNTSYMRDRNVIQITSKVQVSNKVSSTGRWRVKANVYTTPVELLASAESIAHSSSHASPCKSLVHSAPYVYCRC
jgi:FtsP/CotA-like multicopper oxidase with cupredoxin domain